MDQRDKPRWVAIEINNLGEEKIKDGTLEQALRKELKVGLDHPIFIPAKRVVKGQKPLTLFFMEGYVFVASGLPETSYFALERESVPYVDRVLSVEVGDYNIRTLNTIPDSEIQKLKKNFEDMLTESIDTNSYAKVVGGIYNNAIVKVLGIYDKENILVLLELRSYHKIMVLPRASLQVIYDDGV
jgi:hypothetical protein